MLHYLFDYLYISGLEFTMYNLFNYISIRSVLAIIISLFITVYFGKSIINILSKRLVKDDIRDLGLEGQVEKAGTPTMGGVIILIAILIPTLLLCRLNNIYVVIMIITTIWMGLIGFWDDYIKVFKNDKKGLAGRFKIIGQVLLGVFVAIIMYSHPDIVIKENLITESEIDLKQTEQIIIDSAAFSENKKSLKTTIPFLKHNQLDYSNFFFNVDNNLLVFLIFAFIVIFIITAVSNSANLTDGIDGLATGCSAIIGATLGVFCYVSGNMVFANYLDIMYIPSVSELVVFMSSFVGACVGFLWYNSYPLKFLWVT